jgi:hypothetical protein
MICKAIKTTQWYNECQYCGMPFREPNYVPYCNPPPTWHEDPNNPDKGRWVQLTDCKDAYNKAHPKLRGNSFNNCTCESFEVAHKIHMDWIIDSVHAKYG